MTTYYKTEKDGTMNQTQTIRYLINKYLDDGYNNKKDIYAKVILACPKVPRPTIRRVSSMMVKEMQHKVYILKNINKAGVKNEI